ncbi:uncharacterized protein LOC127081798 isoform X2 [Lathyrus oleraceus]|uniref:Uncharacterized protein n=1 Tax=Pisum sativum TaxID=3888 RepID=A0A9D4WJR6_PEA|nr:uncharacterized protein LOC127081798 isoform X2 [Pisum sativum]KAI5402987.1 hypothetical protein KIW84_050549 [Pisum sativum]
MLLLLFQLWDTAKPPPSSVTNTHSFLSLVHLKTSSNIQREQQTMHASAGKRHYKLCALTAIVLIALWSMFTGTVTLKWSTNNVNQFSDGLDSMILEDLDVLEVEEREKVVKHMWDVYTRSHSNYIGLPQFWLEAFEAAYENMVSDVPAVRNTAVSEIAKMSLALRSQILHRLPLQIESPSSSRRSRKLKHDKTQKKLDHYEDHAFKNETILPPK